MKRLLLTLLLAISPLTVMADIFSDYPGLKARFNSYYSLEKDKNWEETFKYRTPGFRRGVNFSNYLKHMKRDSAGWELLEVQPISIDVKDNKVYIRTKFIESVPKSHMEMINREITDKPTYRTRIAAWSVWAKVNGKWYCYNAANRLHLSMNTALIESVE